MNTQKHKKHRIEAHSTPSKTIMGMVKITSKLKLLGNATIDKSGKTTTYSLIEFEDGQILKNVEVDNGLDNFVERALNSGASQTFHLKKKLSAYELIGLKVDDKAYVIDISIWHVVFLGVFGVLTIPFFGVGFFLLILAVQANNTLGIAKDFLAENPNAQKI